MTTGQYINLDNAPPGSTVEHRDDGRTFVWYPKGERVTVKLGGLAPWEVLTAERARAIAEALDAVGWYRYPQILNAYADAVDALTRGKDARTFHEYMDDLADGAS